MRVLVVFTFAFVALAAAERDWSKILSNDRTVALVDGHPVPHKPSTRITHGNVAVPHSRPWQVGLFVPVPGGTTFCGGSLIDDRNVLTAAHCLDRAVGDIEVVLGAQNIRENETTQVAISSSDYLYHERYDSYYLRYDIGLIRLPSPIALNENIQPISLDDSSCSDDYTGRDVNVSGWGRDSGNATSISPVLREVTVPVISNDECTSSYGSYIEPTVICTDGSGGKSTCSGDSGGPLVLDGRKQVGIVSFVATAGCEAGYPAGFTRVCKFTSWIKENKKHPAQPQNGSSSRISVCFSVILLLLVFIFIIY